MNWFKDVKIAYRGNIPTISDPDARTRQENPYYKPDRPSEGQGIQLNTPGDESGGSGFGTRFRGPDAPDDYSAVTEEDPGERRFLPTEDTMFLGEGDWRPVGEGTSERFFDSESPIGRSQEVMRDLSGRVNKDDRLGIHNMPTGITTVYDRLNEVKSRLH